MPLMPIRTIALLLLTLGMVCAYQSPAYCKGKYQRCLETGDEKECAYQLFTCLKGYCYNYAKRPEHVKSYAVKLVLCFGRQMIPVTMWD
ncbi:hypothetical protein ScPMuIL_003415 [Solemya velum]